MLAIIAAAALFATDAAPAPIVDIAAMRAGQLPAAGTPQEADTCAIEGTHMVIAVLQSGEAQPEDAARLAALSVKWVNRAAAFRKIEPMDYGKQPDVKAALLAMDGIDFETHAALDKACIERQK